MASSHSARFQAWTPIHSPARTPRSRRWWAKRLARSSSSRYVSRTSPATRASRSGTVSTTISNRSARLNAIGAEPTRRPGRASPRGRLGRLLELLRGVDHVMGKLPQPGHELTAGDEAEPDAVHVRQDGDVEAGAV